jgi:hypothetical protein
MPNIIDLFNSTNLDPEKLSNDKGYFTSKKELAAIDKLQDKYISNVDYSNPKNFARFGSAEEYYKKAIQHIQNFPYGGSGAEKAEWKNNLNELEYYLFNNEYPRAKGSISLKANQILEIYSGVKKKPDQSAYDAITSKNPLSNNTYVEFKSGMTFETWMKTDSAEVDVFGVNGWIPDDVTKIFKKFNLFKISIKNNKFLFTNFSEIESYISDQLIDLNSWKHYAFKFLDENIKFHAPSHSLDFINNNENDLYTENDERPVNTDISLF